MAQIDLTQDHGYVAAVAVGLWVLQFILSIRVGIERGTTGIKAPTLYPTDKQVAALKLSPAAVDKYMCIQRAHQV